MSALVCVPVYNGFDSVARCLGALAAAHVSAPFRTLLINDASPDHRIRPLLDEFALAHSNTHVRHNASNRGFTWNVNQAFVAARDRFDRLHRSAAASHALTGFPRR